MKNPILVGELNPHGGSDERALYPLPARSSGHRLCTLVMEMQPWDYLAAFDRTNLCEGKWSMVTAREKALSIMREPGRDRIVALGAKVCDALGVEYRPFEAWRSAAGGDRVIVRLPHPSALCRAWNEPGAYERARQALAAAGILPAARAEVA